ncbi:hypothetical protein AB0L71_30915 [Streptomyces sp. NPDC052052]|uniref:hypothetical protein n=1 Tax=Streptomyces sp. NPDC052052 TaxID=3154756 RepID=UPI0034472CF2
MPRITAAQLAYGSVTVVFSTLAMLLLSDTESGVGIGLIGIAALALGLLVAVTVPHPSRAKSAKAGAAVDPNHDPVSAAVEAEGLARDGVRDPVPPTRTAQQRATARVDELLGDPSLRN